MLLCVMIRCRLNPVQTGSDLVCRGDAQTPGTSAASVAFTSAFSICFPIIRKPRAAQTIVFFFICNFSFK